MLTISKKLRWVHTVTVLVPADHGQDEQTCRVTFQLAPTEVLAEANTNADLLIEAVVARIDDLVDGDGRPLDWDDELRREVLTLPYVRMAVIKAYFASVSGARSGNFDGSAGLGRAAN